MKILIIGGSVFLGRAFAEEALRRGHEVTTFNRGVSAPDVPGVEAVRGDREVTADLERLVAGRSWDAVIDVFGSVPRVVGESVRLLSGRAGVYAFISSVSALADWPAGSLDEGAALHECAPDAGPDGEYGPLKAGCERAVEQGFTGDTLIIQPGLILGPYENVGRLPWWLTRISRGGAVLAPGRPDRELQLIDARDIAAFVMDRCEAGGSERFIVSGDRGNATFGGLLAACAEATGADAEFTWVDDAFLLERGVQPWSELPLWAPESPAFAGVWALSTAKATAAGLRCRPVAETVADTWAWLRDIPEAKRSFGTERSGRLGIDPAKEADLLAAWAAARG